MCVCLYIYIYIYIYIYTYIYIREKNMLVRRRFFRAGVPFRPRLRKAGEKKR